ncbi:ABC transporter [Endozoicomonas montiporae]|uniref:ABC transporter n=2 Tax=Endozoicomonas montiporae TaxID=1027273 RepID=A0A081N1R4_9GAMM|nr:ABC transporter ATP-binding protein [Endozoicomonas montiporae]AMO58671.1 putative ABC transport system ATP-binding protein [Endozoicomonas montiporae CL-33]KEQ12387.1 ABC transporter [Endozoicomonas montiporae]
MAKALEKQVVAQSGSLTILSGLDLQIKSGESVAIVGASGSGKSTLLGILAGLDLPTGGEVHLAGNRLDTLDEDQRAKVRARHTGFVFQSFQLLPNLTALENVMLPLELSGSEKVVESSRAILQRVGLSERLDHYPRQLSGGEQQRVAIARAFAGYPDILFADEPTGNLDEKTGESIIQLLFEVNRERGATLVLVTHDMGLASRCDRVLRLTQGVIVEEQRKVGVTA